jgi:hypothetical protein
LRRIEELLEIEDEDNNSDAGDADIAAGMSTMSRSGLRRVSILHKIQK